MSDAPLLAGLPGGTEIWIVLLIILLLFGRRIPQVARSLGQGISQFKKGLNEPGTVDPEDDEEPPTKAKRASTGERPIEGDTV
jgi:sec-independent protein translocase protein TatA